MYRTKMNDKHTALYIWFYIKHGGFVSAEVDLWLLEGKQESSRLYHSASVRFNKSGVL